MPKKTVGAAALELMQKAPDTRNPIELEKELQKDYIANLVECIETHKKDFDARFFVVVLTKNEKLMPNVFRSYFFPRSTCPTPDYDQTVYMYNPEFEQLEYIWTIPSKDACHYLKTNALQVVESERELLKFVLEFADGTLYNRCKELNNELPVA